MRAATSGRFTSGSLLLTLGIGLVGMPTLVNAASGDLDPNFGTNGVAVARIGSNDTIEDLLLQPDGKIVAVGSTAPNPVQLKDSAVARFNPDGTLDPTFGFEGKAVFGFGGYHDSAQAVALQADGKIVIAGHANITETSSQILVARLKQDGILDASFGQNGVTRLDRRQGGSTSEEAYAVAIQPSGKILVAGISSDGSWPGYSVIARLDESGLLDPGFSMIHTANRLPRAMYVYPDGKFLVAGGYAFFGGPRQHWLGRYGVNGSLESDILTNVGGTDGGYAECVKVDFNGGVWTSGYRYNNPNTELVLRKDNVTTIGPSLPVSNGSKMAFQPNGRLAVIGGPFICRYDQNMTLDASFAGDGIMDRPEGIWDPRAIECQGNGSILVGGQSNLGYFAIARVIADGNPPTDISASPAEIAENLPAGSLVASLATTDLDSADVFHYSLTPGTGDTDNAAFSITGNQVFTASVLDFEAGETRSIRVRAVDSGSNIFEKVITVTILNDLSEDIDGDGLNQEQEKFYKTSDFSTDSDGDGIHDYVEIHTHGSNPASRDSDGDGLNDSDELALGTGIRNPDSDEDGLSDGQEIARGALPLDPDTDKDGFLDGYEVQTGKSPTDPLDKPALVAEARTAIEFSFPSALGKTYRIEDSPDMESWSIVEDGIAGNGGTVTRFYSTRNKEKRFFRVEESTSP